MSVSSLSDAPVACLILAAGKGSRMRSNLPKVLHQIANRSMIAHVLHTVCQLTPAYQAVIVAPGMTDLQKQVDPIPTLIQPHQLGTGDAPKAARDMLKDFVGDVLILFGDSPFISAQTLDHMIKARRTHPNCAVTVLGFRPEDKKKYARLIVTDTGLQQIVEFADATDEIKQLDLCNSGFMCIDSRYLFPFLDSLECQNAQGEYYLTDIVKIARQQGLNCAVVEAPESELMGINSRQELAEGEAYIQNQLRQRAMQNGATLIAPETVFFSMDTRLGQDVIIHPHVVFGPGVTVADTVEIKSFCHLEQTHIEAHAEIGPYARLRPGTQIGRKAKIGNFVETKNITLGHGAKVNHLSYVGDGSIGNHANIGAGTIFCNYNGYQKSRTEIGAHAFIGSNSALVAPVTIGAHAIIAAGSTLTAPVPDHALAIGRSPQTVKEGLALKINERNKLQKQAMASPSKTK